MWIPSYCFTRTHTHAHSLLCDFQPRIDDSEPMETDAPTGGELSSSPSLTSLDESKDTFETFLLHLLQAFTSHQQSSDPTLQSESGSETQENTTQNNIGLIKFSNSNISTESLNSLSSEQVSMLITSNSVNYEVIQQILAQKQKQANSSLTNASVGQNHTNQSPPPLEEAKNSGSPPDQTPQEQKTEKSSPSTETEQQPASAGTSTQTTDQQQIQVTPEQLQILQERVSELLRQQDISLPADMPIEQQHSLIQTLLIRQMHLMQEKGENFALPNVDSTVKKPQQPVSSVESKIKPNPAVEEKKPSPQREKKPSAVMQLLTGDEKPQVQ